MRFAELFALVLLTSTPYNASAQFLRGGLDFLFRNRVDPELYFNTLEFICNEGYPAQQHTVVTPQGYVIDIHRIPNGIRKQRVFRGKYSGYLKYHAKVHPDFENCVNESRYERATGPPVLIQHGLMVASDSWVLQGAGHDLAYLLADAGYDVWLSNARGNYYARKNLQMSPKRREFWDFSFHEMAYYDLPSIIDYILKTTNHKQLYYVGHSMGTVMFFIMGDMKPKYMQKIRLSVLLAPVPKLSALLRSPPRSPIIDFLEKSLYEMEKRDKYELLPRANWIPVLANQFCTSKSPFQDLCHVIGLAVDKTSHHNIYRKNFGKMMSHFASGTSIKTVLHFVQVNRAQKLQQFDYGSEENYRRYRQALPPRYNPSKVKCPVGIIYSDADLFSDIDQVESTAQQLPNCVYMKKLANLSHIDFVFAFDAKDKVYHDVMNLMTKY